jgi:protein O-GlcNAc transferase
MRSRCHASLCAGCMPSAAALAGAAADAAGGGDLDSALALVRRALSLEPQSVPALVCLGNVLAERGDTSGAATAYGVALQAAPHSFEAHANAGLLAAEQPGRRAAALAHLRAALAINPGWGDGCYNLANLLSVYEATTAEKLEAVRLYERALRLSPADVDILCNLADCLNDLALFERGEEVAA